jgi:hypothetical protein
MKQQSINSNVGVNSVIPLGSKTIPGFIVWKICIYFKAGVKATKVSAPPILTEIIPKMLYISNIEGSQDVKRVEVWLILYVFL